MTNIDSGPCPHTNSKRYYCASSFCSYSQCYLQEMDEEELQAYRKARLRAAIEYLGLNVEQFGRLLGYESGAFIRQMLSTKPSGRAITEKTIHQIEAMPGMHGWFSNAPPSKPPPGVVELAETDWDMLVAFRDLPEKKRQELLHKALAEAQEYRELSEELLRRYTAKRALPDAEVAKHLPRVPGAPPRKTAPPVAAKKAKPHK